MSESSIPQSPILPAAWYGYAVVLKTLGETLGGILLDANTVGVLIRFSNATVFYPWPVVEAVEWTH